MNITRIDPQTLSLTGLDSFVCALLREIVPSSTPGDHPAARARLYSSPSGGNEPEFDADWREYVEPSLREHFEANLSLVERDLAKLPKPGSSELGNLEIPVAHLDSWLNALNQARLALAARHEISEHDMEAEILLGEPRGFALFQIEFYGSLQFYFIQELQRE